MNTRVASCGPDAQCGIAALDDGPEAGGRRDSDGRSRRVGTVTAVTDIRRSQC